MGDQLPQIAGRPSPLGDTESLLGAYENTPGDLENLVLFTDHGLHWWTDHQWHSLAYAEIVSTEWPAGEKTAASGVFLRTLPGRRVHLPIGGGTELTRDLFEVMRFIDRVIEDQGRTVGVKTGPERFEDMAVAVPPKQAIELDRRLADHQAKPEDLVAWQEIKDATAAKYDKKP